MIKGVATLVGKGNPLHLDTTFGNAAFVTITAYKDIRLITTDGRHPLVLGPVLVHSKERDSSGIGWFFRQIQDAIEVFNRTWIGYFISDECSVLARRINQIWPNAVHCLGREHLIYNFNRNGQKMTVPDAILNAMKREVFGPSGYDNKPCLLDVDECEWDQAVKQLHSSWLNRCPSAARFAEFLKVRNAK